MRPAGRAPGSLALSPTSASVLIRSAARISLFALLLTGLAACSSNNPVECAPGGGVDVTDVTLGTGSAVANVGSVVTVAYVGTLADGSEFDSNSGATFSLANTIPGFAIGIDGMKIGGRRTIVIPPNYGYGAFPPDGIPACATLTFDVTLLDVR